MAATPAPKVAVYKDGKRELHTRPNARDLVQGAGYSWSMAMPSQPAAIAPYATSTPPSEKAQSQEVVDKIGGTLNSMHSSPQPAAPTFAETLDEEDDGMSEAEAAGEDADEPDTLESAPTRRRGRGRSES